MSPESTHDISESEPTTINNFMENLEIHVIPPNQALDLSVSTSKPNQSVVTVSQQRCSKQNNSDSEASENFESLQEYYLPTPQPSIVTMESEPKPKLSDRLIRRAQLCCTVRQSWKQGSTAKRIFNSLLIPSLVLISVLLIVLVTKQPLEHKKSVTNSSNTLLIE